ILKHPFKALRRRFYIEVCVSVSAVKSAEISNDALGAFRQENGDGLVPGGAALEEQRGAVLGKTCDFRKGIFAVLIFDGHLVRAFEQSAFLKIINSVDLHC